MTPSRAVACTDTSLVMATRSGIMASLNLEGCPTKEMYGNAIPAAIIPATPTRIPHVSLLPHQVPEHGVLEQVAFGMSAYHNPDVVEILHLHKQRLLLHSICLTILSGALASPGKSFPIQVLLPVHRTHRWSACPATATMAPAAGQIVTPKHTMPASTAVVEPSLTPRRVVIGT